MRSLLGRLLAAVFVCAAASPAHADWHDAKSKHFIIYADERPDKLLEFATRLEKFDRAVRFVRGMDDPAVGDGNRLTVFVLPTATAVQKLVGDKSGFIAGYYIPRASGPLAFVPKKTGTGAAWDLNADTVFFHEYSHHLMMQVLERPLPEWVIEGFAEFMATVRFEKDGSVGLGAPANHRAWGLFEGQALPLDVLLSGNYSKITVEQRESIYGYGWLLVHYLTFEPARRGQLDRYADALTKGVAPLDAARQTFGDLEQLKRDLRGYLTRRRMSYLRISGNQLQPGPIDVRSMSAGGAKVILLRAQSKSGVDQKTAEPLAQQIRAIQARFPGDELVEATLAEAELDAGRATAAEAAADRALKANPRNTEALVLKGRAIAERAEKATGPERSALFDQARKTFIAANKIDPEDPEPLMEFYHAFAQQGTRPTANAIAALHYASDLAPQDPGLRMNSAMQYLVEGKAKEARRALAPVAYNPHGARLAQIAREMITNVDSGDLKRAISAASAGSKDQSTEK